MHKRDELRSIIIEWVLEYEGNHRFLNHFSNVRLHMLGKVLLDDNYVHLEKKEM